MICCSNDIMKKFGAKVKHYRELAGLTQEQLAKKCECSAQTISGTETGYSFPSSKILFNISFALNTPLVYFFNFDDDKNVTNNELYTVLNNALKKMDLNQREMLLKIIKAIVE